MQIPKEPVRIALIGAGHRSNRIYKPLFPGLKPWIKVVAVCDPVKEHADSMAEALGAKAYYQIQDMVREAEIEAAIVVAPIPLHYPYSVYLSEHKIHNLIETTWCSTLGQARAMIDAARRNGVYTRVAENFFRYPIDRFAQTLRDNGYIGDIKRVFSYNDHTGYHSNSRWIVFAKEYPDWISSTEHTMEVMPGYQIPERYIDHETFRSRFIHFPSNLMVIDQAANIKGMLGRHVRPGYTEWQGYRGTLVQQGGRYEAPTHWFLDNNRRVERGFGVHPDWEAELRCSVYEDSTVFNEEEKPVHPNYISKVERFYDENFNWLGVRAFTPEGTIQYDNPIRIGVKSENYYPEYGIAVAGHMIDFALQIRGLADSEFTEEDAYMSMMMEMCARESAMQGGRRISMPYDGELEIDTLILKKMKESYGVDPLDVEAMMSYVHQKP